jgi:hypothetical protein
MNTMPDHTTRERKGWGERELERGSRNREGKVGGEEVRRETRKREGKVVEEEVRRERDR